VIDEESLFTELAGMGLDAWCDELLPVLRENLADRAHGRLAAWREILHSLPAADDDNVNAARIRELLLKLAPWRKGPFSVRGVVIDAEWRSDLKWQRLEGHISPLADRNVLDVGCGNGYYAFRMLQVGATRVIGLDPTLLFLAQFGAIRKLTGIRGAHVLPLRLEDLPPHCRAFDTTFSMGVLYHQREPAAHLSALHGTLRPGGTLVLETLILPGDADEVLEPRDRYARMRNVWHLPTIAALRRWLGYAGFNDPQPVDVTTTSVAEQRTTEWMTFESLAAALDPGDPSRTVEGLPAPTRAIFVCSAL